jgi:hypothetical protein
LRNVEVSKLSAASQPASQPKRHTYMQDMSCVTNQIPNIDDASKERKQSKYKVNAFNGF